MSAQLSISLGALKHISDELNKELDGVNISQINISKEGPVVSAYWDNRLLAQYDTEVIEKNMSIQQPFKK